MARTKRTGILDKEPLLDDLHRCRKAAVRVRTEYPINGDAYNAAGAVLTSLDGLSEALTGNRKAHWPIRREG